MGARRRVSGRSFVRQALGAPPVPGSVSSRGPGGALARGAGTASAWRAGITSAHAALHLCDLQVLAILHKRQSMLATKVLPRL